METVNMESGEYIAAFSTAFHHMFAGARFPKPNCVNLCCISISKGFSTGKEDHYYIQSLRTLIYALFCLARNSVECSCYHQR